MGTLKGKNVFITGTSQGIGAVTSKALIEAGCNIAMHYFRSDETPLQLKKFADSQNQKAICIQADLTDEKQAIKAVKAAADFLGSIDILINNSGSLVERRYLSAITNDYWQTLLDVNLKSMMLATREALPFLNKREGSSRVSQ